MLDGVSLADDVEGSMEQDEKVNQNVGIHSNSSIMCWDVEQGLPWFCVKSVLILINRKVMLCTNEEERTWDTPHSK